jgi:hypothetical protein
MVKCGKPEEAVEYYGNEDCFKWPLPPLNIRSKGVQIIVKDSL